MDAKKTPYVPENEEDIENDLLESRSTLVRLRKRPSSTIFRGWGIKI